MTNSFYRGKVSVVTGAASGIGKALAEELANRGAYVILLDIQSEKAKEVETGITSRGKVAKAISADVTDLITFKQVTQQIIQEYGNIDYLFNNAGILIEGESFGLSDQDWHKIIDVNLFGVINGIQCVYPHMVKQGFGHIVNTASLAGLLSLPLATAYTTTKHAVVGLTKCLRIEAARHNVKVSALCPGFILTPLILPGGGKQIVTSPISEARLNERARRLHPTLPEQFAKHALEKVEKNKAIIYSNSKEQFLEFLCKVSVKLQLKIAEKMIKSALKHYPEFNLTD